MPRPRVRPENRQRSSRACKSCKASKIRCDSKQPCAACIRRGRPANCSYPTIGKRDIRSNASTSGEDAVPPALTSTTPSVMSNSPPSGSSILSPQSQTTTSLIPELHGTMSGVPCTDHDSPRDRFVTGSNGEKIYIGDTASISFLDFLRVKLRPFVGSMPFTDAQQNTMLEDVVEEAHVDGTSLTKEQKRAFLLTYSEVTSSMLHLLSPNEIDAFLEHEGEGASTKLSKQDAAALEMAVAIGAQARALDETDVQCAAAYFTRARQVAFEGMLAFPSLGMVRLFILLAFYTLGACQQSAAFIYLGVASKAAIVLGLHQPMSWKYVNMEPWSDLRLRIWHSLCILDVFTSSIMGRPCTVPRATRHDIHALPFDPNQPAFNACLKGAALLDDIGRILSRGKMIDVATAEDLLEKLRVWSRELPSSLRQVLPCEKTSTNSTDRQAFLCRVHVSGLYYFSVILVTRPFLIQHLMRKIRRTGIDGRSNTVDLDPGIDAKVSELAQVCMSSAAYMGDLCQKTADIVATTSIPFGNLCLFKAWIFSAGLILGFSLFAGESGPDFQDSFAKVQEVLNRIGQANPQSKIYSEILGTFSDTISAHRRQVSRNARRAVDRYIDQIIDTDVERGVSAGEFPVSHDSTTNFPWKGDLNDPSNVLNSTLPGQIEWDENWFSQQSWDDVAMQFSDNFAIDYSTQLT